MRLGSICRTAIAAIGLLWMAAAPAQDAMTTRERKALSPRAASRNVREDLWSVFEPIGRISSGTARQLHGVGLQTRAFGTKYDGLCRRDMVSLLYAAAGEASKFEDVPVQPYGVEARALYHFLDAPKRARERSADIWQARCETAGRDDHANWFTAPDARTAVLGALALKAAADAVQAGTIIPEPCGILAGRGKRICDAAILANGDPAVIQEIEICASTAGALCYVVYVDSSLKLTIRVRDTGDTFVPGPVSSVAVDEEIIVD